MNILKSFILALVLGPAMVANAQANTEVTVEITNNTRGTLNMTNLLTDPPQAEDYPLSDHDIPPKSIYMLHLTHERNYTYPASGWQPTLKKVKPIELVLSYKMKNFNFECQMQTLFQAPIAFGFLEPSYKPNWKSDWNYTGNGEFTCRTEITRKMLEPPFSYTVRLIIE
ncbi:MULTISPECIES: hypothetical protein [Pseudomonas]|uniref:hypothetical protein n=1 Tax=Pseudomonas TaxID=286 RepID=UPI001BEB13CD|nr:MULTISPECIES: hypothetical protein [Pseudomonas]MBT2340326.1 hypothetical protein [Pseudomonas fluorescens]MCD4529360.1 hypothetical protein [Pseudomonas sp. C3-2018]